MKEKVFSIGKCLKGFGIEIKQIKEIYSIMFEKMYELKLKDGSTGTMRKAGKKGSMSYTFETQNKYIRFSRYSDPSKININKNGKKINIPIIYTDVHSIYRASDLYHINHLRKPVGLKTKTVNGKEINVPQYQEDLAVDVVVGKNCIPYDTRILPNGKQEPVKQRSIYPCPWL